MIHDDVILNRKVGNGRRQSIGGLSLQLPSPKSLHETRIFHEKAGRAMIGHMDSEPLAPMVRQSAVLIPVPEAEQVVSRHRVRLVRALTGAVSAVFPGYLPYGGAHDDVVPHLTIGDRPARGTAGSRGRSAARPAGRARIGRVWLMTGTTAPGSWHVMAELPLATP
jgi:hypothetical protein